MHRNLRLRQAYQLYRGGALAQAKQVLAALIKGQADPDSLHLLGLVEKAAGRAEQAEKFLRRALEARPMDAQIKSSLGSLYYSMGAFKKAWSLFDPLMDGACPGADICYNAILVLLSLKRWEEGHSHAKAACTRYATDARFPYLLGKIEHMRGALDAAATYLHEAVELRGEYFEALYMLADISGQQGVLEEARSYIARALALRPQSFEAWLASANLEYSAGSYSEAAKAYLKALSLKPGHVGAHVSLNKLYMDAGNHEQFGRSFAAARQSGFGSEDLALAEMRALEQVGALDEVAARLKDAMERYGVTPGLMAQQSRLLGAKGDFEAALRVAEKMLASAEKASPQWLLDHVVWAIRSGALDRAHHSLDILEKMNPDDQQVWAYRGLAWRLSDDRHLQERERWLNDYERFVVAQTLPCPEGYKDLSDFLCQLAHAIRSQHHSTRAPLDQTLHGGTQSQGKLLHQQNRHIEAYQQALKEVVARYIGRFDREEEHPFLRRLKQSFSFSASWSVRLGRGGYHINHVHPLGWLSSAFYVAIDEGVTGNASDKAGWIAFGQSGLRLPGGKDVPRKWFKPDPGMLVLFPSYIWHGTVPTVREGERLTAPFDVVPIEEKSEIGGAS